MNKQITINGIKILVVEVPDTTTEYSLSNHSIGIKSSANLDLPIDTNGWYHLHDELGKYRNCISIGLLKELSETDCERLVDSKKHPIFRGVMYKDYSISNPVTWLNSAKESLVSLLQNEGFDTNKNLLLIEIL